MVNSATASVFEQRNGTILFNHIQSAMLGTLPAVQSTLRVQIRKQYILIQDITFSYQGKVYALSMEAITHAGKKSVPALYTALFRQLQQQAAAQTKTPGRKMQPGR